MVTRDDAPAGAGVGAADDAEVKAPARFGVNQWVHDLVDAADSRGYLFVGFGQRAGHRGRDVEVTLSGPGGDDPEIIVRVAYGLNLDSLIERLPRADEGMT